MGWRCCSRGTASALQAQNSEIKCQSQQQQSLRTHNQVQKAETDLDSWVKLPTYREYYCTNKGNVTMDWVLVNTKEYL
jgi:hypothetical protein